MPDLIGSNKRIALEQS